MNNLGEFDIIAQNLLVSTQQRLCVEELRKDLTQSATMPPPTKRRRTEPTVVEEITFDPSSRHDFLTGFHKRKLERAKHAREAAERRAREERVEHRKQVGIRRSKSEGNQTC